MSKSEWAAWIAMYFLVSGVMALLIGVTGGI